MNYFATYKFRDLIYFNNNCKLNIYCMQKARNFREPLEIVLSLAFNVNQGEKKHVKLTCLCVSHLKTCAENYKKSTILMYTRYVGPLPFFSSGPSDSWWSLHIADTLSSCSRDISGRCRLRTSFWSTDDRGGGRCASDDFSRYSARAPLLHTAPTVAEWSLTWTKNSFIFNSSITLRIIKLEDFFHFFFYIRKSKTIYCTFIISHCIQPHFVHIVFILLAFTCTPIMWNSYTYYTLYI